MKFCLLASGSRGNAIWVEEGDLALVVDCGLSAREFLSRAGAAGLDISRLSCLLVSHEHRDHISGLGVLARRLKIPVLANAATCAAASPLVGRVQWEIFTTGDTLNLGSLKIRTLGLSHDAADPVAFVLESQAGRLGLATDLGAPTELIKHKFQALAALILEFNHDYRLLMDGPSPWPLKQRVRGRTGHLANETAADFAAELYHREMKHLILAHLSETNNNPALALKAAREALDGALEPVAASQGKPTAVFEF
jgi:phosphoribosyl 1,2-cyclic phosphodiesterase